MRDDLVDHAHPVRVVGGVLVAEEEDLAGELLADLAGEVRRPEAAVERADVGVGLLEPAVLGAGEGEVGDDVQGVAAAGRPAVDQADDDLGHEADQPLALEDVQPARAGPCRPGSAGRPRRRAVGLVLVARAAADPLVAAGAERPLAVLVAGAVAGEQHAADVAGGARVLEDPQQLVDGVRPERVEHVGAVEGDPDRAVRDRPVVGQVGQVLEPGDRTPGLGVEDLGHTLDGTHGAQAIQPAPAARRTVGAMTLSGEYEPSPEQWVRDQVEQYEATGGRGGEHPPRPPRVADRGDHLARREVRASSARTR